MARSSINGVPEVLAAAERWRVRCLLGEGSIFSEARLWTSSNLATLKKAFLGNLIEDPDRKFYEKLHEQMEKQPPEVIRLAAEMTWLLLLFPSRIDGSKKRQDIQAIWSWSNAQLPASHPELGEFLNKGVGHAGVAFNTHRWREFGFFLEWMGEFRSIPEVRRAGLLAEPWEFARWIDEETPSKSRALRHILLYLLFPEQFERIANTRHRRAIVCSFAAHTGQTYTVQELKQLSRLDLDRAIARVRQHLATQHPNLELDFYRPPVAGTFSLTFPPTADGQAASSEPLPRTIDKSDPESAAAVLKALLPDEALRRPAMDTLGRAIDIAHRCAPQRWAVTMTRHRISLNVGRLLVVEIRRARFAITVAKSAVASMAAVAGLPERVETESFATAPGLQLCRLSAKDLPSALPYLLAGLDEGVREAARTARRALGVVHAPGVLEYANQELGRVLPRPAGPLGGSVVPEAVAVSTPTAGFRATELDLASLISDVANGYTGLPDIQRPFVWTSAKVRDLFDSMYRGYPVGYLLFWETNTAQQATRVIGVNDKAYKTPRRLIVDGQQRLTSLFAVMRGVEVLDEDYRAIKIEIAFRPRDGRFEVADAAIRNDPEFIPSISTLLSDDRGSYALIRDFLSRLGQRRNLTDRDQHIVGRNLERLFSLKQYRFSVLEISSELDEEAVADIFVRINSEGVKLNQADFILTLLSVIWEEGRAELEKFSREALRPPTRHGAPSPFNHLVAPSPDQLLRVSVALAFNRARMKSVYHLLRGKDPDSGAFIVERRSENLRLLQGAQQLALDLDHWHRFLSCTTAAGFRLREQVSSQNALLTAYALYIRGLTSARVSPVELDRLVGRWLWMAILTSRFSTSPETAMEEDLTSVAGIEEAARFVDALERTISAALTNDYWNITLPIELETSSPRAAGWATFVAAQLRLDAPVLFSDKKLWAILDPLMRGKRRQFEAHHLFPKAWLVAQGIADRRDVNQIANLAFLEWPANARAGSRGPDKYGPELREHISEAAWERMCRLHALPAEWHTMDYPQFLSARRPLMAQLIRRGFSTLSAQSDDVVQDEASGSDAENGVWQQISRLERELRVTLRRLATGHWGTVADERIRRILGPDALSTLERHREKYAAQYKFTPARHGNELLDFLYLAQLVDIMKNNEVWPMFNSTFRDKRQLEDLIAAIVPVRNDAAHFRTVPSRELERCRIAVGDLAVLIARI